MHVTSCHQVLNVMFAIAAKKLYRCCGCCWTNGTLPGSTPDSKLHDDRHCYMHSQHPGSSDAWLLPEFQPLPALKFWVLRWWYSIQTEHLETNSWTVNCEAELLNSEQKNIFIKYHKVKLWWNTRKHSSKLKKRYSWHKGFLSPRSRRNRHHGTTPRCNLLLPLAPAKPGGWNTPICDPWCWTNIYPINHPVL
jgi:hypothetical protein